MSSVDIEGLDRGWLSSLMGHEWTLLEMLSNHRYIELVSQHGRILSDYYDHVFYLVTSIERHGVKLDIDGYMIFSYDSDGGKIVTIVGEFKEQKEDRILTTFNQFTVGISPVEEYKQFEGKWEEYFSTIPVLNKHLNFT